MIVMKGLIRLWRNTESNFLGNEFVLSECTKCTITEELQGSFILELEYPLNDKKGLSEYLRNRGWIITAPVYDNRTEQRFRITRSVTTSTSVKVTAKSKILADMQTNYVRSFTIKGMTRKQAIEYVFRNALEKNNYKAGNRDTNTNKNVIYHVREDFLTGAIIGEADSLMSKYGGEFIFDNDTLDLVDKRGSDKGYVVAYGKNMEKNAVEETKDDSDLATVLIPKCDDYRLPEYCIESPYVNNYEKRYFKEISVSLNIWNGQDEKQEDQITLQEAYQIMRDTCKKKFSNDRIDMPAYTYKINMINVNKTTKYKDYQVFNDCELGDTVTIRHERMKVNIQGRVNKIVYDVLGDKITNVEVGFKKKDVTNVINQNKLDIQFAKQEVLMRVNNVSNTLSAQIKISENKIIQEVDDKVNAKNAQIELNTEKIDAVVTSKGQGMGWELSKDAFIVACKGASDSYTQIDGSGLTVNDGKIKVKRNGSTVFRVNSKGVCQADGGFVVESGDLLVEITDNGFELENSDGYRAVMTLSDRTEFYIPDDLRVGNYLRVDDRLHVYENKLRLLEGADLQIRDGGSCSINGDLSVEGDKDCLMTTKDYGKRKISAYETAEYYFGDIGSGVIDESGECVVFIEEIFGQCVNTNVEYQVFTQCYKGGIIELDRKPNYFVVKGEAGTIFGWEIKAKRLGRENIRLEEMSYENEDKARDFKLLDSSKENTTNMSNYNDESNLEDELLNIVEVNL